MNRRSFLKLLQIASILPNLAWLPLRVPGYGLLTKKKILAARKKLDAVAHTSFYPDSCPRWACHKGIAMYCYNKKEADDFEAGRLTPL
jgi:hypothetical protein